MTVVVADAEFVSVVPPGVVETLVNAYMFDMGIRLAVAHPRIHQQLSPSSVTEYEGEWGW